MAAADPYTYEFYHQSDRLIAKIQAEANDRLTAAMRNPDAAAAKISFAPEHQVRLSVQQTRIPESCCCGCCTWCDAASWAGTYFHIELWFQATRLAFSAQMDDERPAGCMAMMCCALCCGGSLDCCGFGVVPFGPVMYRRDFLNDSYHHYKLQLNQYWVDLLFLSCVDELGKDFNAYSRWRVALGCCWKFYDGTSHNCASAVWTALLNSGVLRHLKQRLTPGQQENPLLENLESYDPGQMTPTAIVEIMTLLGAVNQKNYNPVTFSSKIIEKHGPAVPARGRGQARKAL